MTIKESGEDFQETVLILQERNSIVRSVGVAAELGVDRETALKDACRIEHALVPRALKR